MITALERINIEHDCQLVVERWENGQSEILKSFVGTKLESVPQMKWSMWNFNVGRVDLSLGCRPVGAEQCRTLKSDYFQVFT